MKYSLKLVIYATFLLFSLNSFGQSFPNGIEASFAKENITQGIDSTLFNVFKIKNTTEQPISISIKYLLPTHWAFVSTPRQEITLIPGKTHYVPFRIVLSSQTIGGMDYSIKIELSSNDWQQSISFINKVSVPSRRDWRVTVNNRVFFPTDQHFTALNITVSNKGNQIETVKIFFDLTDNIALSLVSLKAAQEGYMIPPGKDTIISYPVHYSKKSLLYNRYESIEIDVLNDLKKVKKVVFFEKFDNAFDNSNRRRTNSYIELSGNNLFNSTLAPQIQSYGFMQMKLSKDSNLFLNYSSANIADYENIEEQSRGTLQFINKKWDIGIGNVNEYGNDIHNINTNEYINNKVFSVKRKLKLNKSTAIVPYISKSLDKNVINTGLGFERRTDLLTIQNIFSTIQNVDKQKNLYIYASQNSLQINENSYLTAIINGVRTNYTENNSTENSFNYLLDYQGTYKQNLNYNIESAYYSPRFSNQQRGVGFLSANTTYGLKNTKGYISTYFSRVQLLEDTYEDQVVEPVNPYVLSRYGTQYQMIVSSTWNFGLETSIDDYHITDKLGSIAPAGETFHARMLLVGFSLFSRRNNHEFSYYLKQGFHQGVQVPISTANGGDNTELPLWSLETYLQYRYKNLYLRAQYTNGLMSPVLQYFYLRNPFYPNALNVSTSWNKKIWKEVLEFRLFSTTQYRPQRNIVTNSFSPSLQINLPNNWQLFSWSSVASVYRINSPVQSSPTYNFRVGVRKQFNWSAYETKKYNVKLVFFKDNNNNNLYDNGEEKLKNIISEISYNTIYNDNRPELPPLNITLVSDTLGTIHLKKVPEGNYNLKIRANKELHRQFYAKGKDRLLTINNDKTIYIPFGESFNIYGNLDLVLDKFTTLKGSNTMNIRVTAVSKEGVVYETLTDANGYYKLNLPKSEYYTISIKNPFKSRSNISLNRNKVKVAYNEHNDEQVNFEFKEKKRTIKFNN